jgi:hypothetical protein
MDRRPDRADGGRRPHPGDGDDGGPRHLDRGVLPVRRAHAVLEDQLVVHRSQPPRQRTTPGVLYAGGFPTYQERCAEEAAANYPGFTLS